MTLLCLLAAVATFMLFGFASDHQYRRHVGSPLRATRRRLLRCLAWLGVALCLVTALDAEGRIYGAVLWLGSLSFGAATSFLFLNFMPARH